jgi:hypothetical protein
MLSFFENPCFITTTTFYFFETMINTGWKPATTIPSRARLATMAAAATVATVATGGKEAVACQNG